jgi:integrase
MAVYFKIKANNKRVWYYDINIGGKRKRGVAGATKREAEKMEAILKAKYHQGDSNLFQKPNNPVFREFSDKYLRWSKANKASWRRDEQFIAVLVRWFGDIKLSSIDAGDIEEFKIERQSDTARGNGYVTDRPISNSTINKELACLKRMFNLAIEWKDANSNPLTRIRNLPETSKQERYITLDEFERLYEAAGATLKPVLLIAYHTGMRTEEFLSLTWSQVHLNVPPRRVVGSDLLNYGWIELFKTKSGRAREVPINRTLWEYFMTQERNPDDYVLRSSQGDRFTTILVQFKAALKRAGLKSARVHDLRGSWATRMNENGVDTHAIMQIGGWGSLKMLERYLRRNVANLMAAVQTFDEPDGEKHATYMPPKTVLRKSGTA